jgi:hypothetical protein
MKLSSATPLKFGAVVLALLWLGAMLWRTGTPGPLEIFVFVFCGTVCSYGWYQGTYFLLGRFGVLPPERDETAEARRGKVYPWIVFVAVMMATRQLTVWLLGVIEPHIPAADWHHLTQALFIMFVWPGLWWSLLPLIRQHLPPPKRRGNGGSGDAAQ